MPRINLLPWREQQRAERKKSFGVGMAAAALGAFAVAGAGWLLMNGAIDGQNGRNQRLTDEIKVLDKQIEEINSLEAQKQQFIARMQIIETLQRSRPEIVHVFDTFVRTMPDGTYLTSIVQTGQRFQLKGVAQSATRVSSFMRSISASEWLVDPELEVVENQRGNAAAGSNFTLFANQVTTLGDNAAAPAPGAKK